MATPNQVSIVFNYTSVGKAAAQAELQQVSAAAELAAAKATKSIDRQISSIQKKSAADSEAARSALVFLRTERDGIEASAIAQVNANAVRKRSELELQATIAAARASNKAAAAEELAQQAARAAAVKRGFAGIAEAAALQRDIELQYVANEKRLTVIKLAEEEKRRLAIVKTAETEAAARGATLRNAATGVASAAGLGFAGGPLAAGVGGALALGFASSTALDIERTVNALKAVTGSSETARQEFAFITREAERLGVAVQPLAYQFTQFTAASKGTALEGERARQIFLAVAETAATLGLKTEETEGALRALGQIMSKGKVQAEELRGQLGDRLSGAFQIFARAAGLTTAQLDALLKTGGVIATDTLPAFGAELRKTFGTDANTRIETTVSNFTRLTNEIRLSAAALGDLVNKGASPAAGAFAAFLRDVRSLSAGDRLSVGGAALTGGLSGAVDAYTVLLDAQKRRQALSDNMRVGPAGVSFFNPLSGVLPGSQESLQGSALLTNGQNSEANQKLTKLRAEGDLLRANTELRKFEIKLQAGQFQGESDLYIAAARRNAQIQDAVAAEKKAASEGKQLRKKELAEIEADEKRHAAELMKTDDDALDAARQRIKDELEARNKAAAEVERLQERLGLGKTEAEFNRDLRTARRSDGAAGVNIAEVTQDAIDSSDERFARDGAILESGRVKALAAENVDKAAINDEFRKNQERLERLHQAELTRIKADGISAEKALQAAQLQAAQSTFSTLADAALLFGKKGFAAYKALKIVETTISTISSAQAAYESAAKVPVIGFALAPAAAAAAVALGLANVAQIRATSYGGGRETGGPVGSDKFYEVGEKGRPELLENNGKFYLINANGNVNPASQGTAAAAGGVGGPVRIEVINLQGQTAVAQQAEGPNGDQIVRLIVQTVKSDVAAGGPISKQLDSTYGTRRSGF